MRSLDGNLYINAKRFGCCASQAGARPGHRGNQGSSMGTELHGEAVHLCEVTRGRNVPVSLSCLSPLVEPELSRLVQLPQPRSRGTMRVFCSPRLQQGLAFPVKPAKGCASFLSHLTTAGAFTCSS